MEDCYSQELISELELIKSGSHSSAGNIYGSHMKDAMPTSVYLHVKSTDDFLQELPQILSQLICYCYYPCLNPVPEAKPQWDGLIFLFYSTGLFLQLLSQSWQHLVYFVQDFKVVKGSWFYCCCWTELNAIELIWSWFVSTVVRNNSSAKRGRRQSADLFLTVTGY